MRVFLCVHVFGHAMKATRLLLVPVFFLAAALTVRSLEQRSANADRSLSSVLAPAKKVPAKKASGSSSSSISGSGSGSSSGSSSGSGSSSADPAGLKMQTDKDKSCSQDRLEKKLKDMRDGKAVAEMITAWTTFVMSGEQPKLGVYATKALAARPGLKKVWDLGKGLLTHKDYIKCPERHVFWSDYGAGAKHMAQLFAKKNKQTTVEMCGAGHFMESKVRTFRILLSYQHRSID